MTEILANEQISDKPRERLTARVKEISKEELILLNQILSNKTPSLLLRSNYFHLG
jgi:hypothetical protein